MLQSFQKRFRKIVRHEKASYLFIPLAQCDKIGDVDDVVGHDPFQAVILPGRKRHIPAAAGAAEDQAAGTQFVLAVDGAGGDDGAVFQAAGTDQAALPSQEKRGLIQHHPARDVPQQRGGRLVLVGSEVKVDIGTADLAVIFAVGTAGHQAIAEIDQASQSDKREQDRLFQADGMRNAGFLFDYRSLPDVGAGTGRGAAQKDSVFKKAAVQAHIRADLAIDNGHGLLIAQTGALQDEGGAAEDPASGMDHDIVPGNAIGIDIHADFDRIRRSYPHSFIDELLDGHPITFYRFITPIHE